MSPRAPAPLRALWGGLPVNIRGALWVMLAATLLTLMGALVKHLGREIHPFQLVFARCFIGTLFVVPFMLRAGLDGFRTRRPWLHVLRVTLGLTGMFCVFYSFAHMPLADAIAIIFSRPLFAVVLAILVLGEVVGWRRAAAAVVGFSGVLIMMRPGTGAFEPVALVAVAGAFMAGTIAVIVKKMSATESTTTIIIWFTIGGSVVSLVPAAAVWSWPTAPQWALLVLVGALGVAGQAALTKGFSTGETSFVTPFDYSRLVIASLLGIFVFAEFPDLWSVVGALVIVGSGYYIARRELRLDRARRRAADAGGDAVT